MLWNGTKPDSSLWRSDGVDWTVQEPVTVERDACGVPVAWKILSQGGNPLVRNGIAGELLAHICTDMATRKTDTLYLITEHTAFYERYGWEYLCPVCGDDGVPMRMYRKRTPETPNL